ncbi:MAG: hypothetical protein IIB06_04285 [Bacteroidetes bacterium]|nr:hypothetical protein [Bacteroidota bacterium]
MKKITLLVALALLIFSCKNTEEKDPKLVSNETSDSKITIYQGEFIYLADAAVLKGSNFIYGVALDEMSEELAKQVETVKKEEFDMVPVIVKGIVSKKPEGQEGWDEILTIKEILSVSKTPSKTDIKLEVKKE